MTPEQSLVERLRKLANASGDLYFTALTEAADRIEELERQLAAPAELPPLPEPIEIIWPTLHSNALGCGVEDRGIRDRYEAAEYGWQDGVDKAAECVPEELYTADQMREYARAAQRAAPTAQPTYSPETLKRMRELDNKPEGNA